MPRLHLTPTTLRVEFTLLEKIAGLLRDLEVPLQSVSEVVVEPDGLSAVRGLRAPGLAVPWLRKIGTWRGKGRRAIVSVAAGRPALRLTLRGHKVDEIVLGGDGVEDWGRQLRDRGVG